MILIIALGIIKRLGTWDKFFSYLWNLRKWKNIQTTKKFSGHKMARSPSSKPKEFSFAPMQEPTAPLNCPNNQYRSGSLQFPPMKSKQQKTWKEIIYQTLGSPLVFSLLPVAQVVHAKQQHTVTLNNNSQIKNIKYSNLHCSMQ